MARPVPIALALLVLTGLLGAAFLPDRLPAARAQLAPLSQNDAGSGQDAGNSPSDALLTASANRVYAGNLSPAGTDADWFRHDVRAAFCSEVQATLSTAGQVTLAGDAALGAAAAQGALPHESVALALAVPAGGTPFLGIEPGASLASVDGGPTQPGRYTFKFVSHGLADLDPEGDGEWPDAGDTAETATRVPTPCFAGRLAGGGDATDRWFFDVDAPREITVSLAVARGSTQVQLALVAPDGSVRATLASGEAEPAYADQVGRWSLVVTRTGDAPAAANVHLPLLAGSTTLIEDSDYLLALGFGPGSDPCRPSC